MKDNLPSSTALLIARATLLAAATPGLRSLVSDDQIRLTQMFLESVGPARWLDYSLRYPFLRRILLAVESIGLPGIIAHWMVRKLLLEQYAHSALARGCKQIVVLGAGLDTLAWRLCSKASCFELDHPGTHQIKRRVTTMQPILAAIDLQTNSPFAALLDDTHFQSGKTTFFIAEGLLMYLSASRVKELFSELSTLSAPGSQIAFTFMEQHPSKALGFEAASPLINWWLRWRTEPFRWGLASDDAVEFLQSLGWDLEKIVAEDGLRREFLAPLGLGYLPLAIGESVALATVTKPERHDC